LEKIENAFVCTGSNEHFKYIKILLKKKINIFVEKPLMNSTKKVNELKKICKNSKNKIYVGYNLLFSNSLNFLKNMKLHKEKINKVNIKSSSYLPYWRKNIDYKESVSADKNKGGGVLLELSHELNYLIWLFGRPIWTSAIVQKVSNLKLNVEDNALITFRFKRFTCNLELDFVSKQYERYCKIDTDKKTYLWDFKKNTIKRFNKNNKSKIIFQKKFDLNESYKKQLNYFLNSNYIQINKYIHYSIDTLKVIDAIKISSSKNGALVKINYKD